MRDKLRAVVEEYDRLGQLMSSPEVASNPQTYTRHAKKQRQIAEIVTRFNRFLKDEAQLEGARAMLREESDPEMRALAEDEKRQLEEAIDEHEAALRMLLLPKNPNDTKNTIVEIRAGTGGDEATLFAGELYRAYSRFAETKGWRVEVLNSSPSSVGGFKEIAFKITGDNVYSLMKFEGGVHRVQRVPVTETQGRVHTSAVTVAVLPEAEEVDLQIDPNDLQIDVYRSSGPGGQSVNTTDSAVRITHKPSGLVVTCQDEKSQHKNKARALEILRARLYAMKQEEEDAKRSEDRRSQVGTGDRSAKIRTYNFPENRVTDHRIGLTLHQLRSVMEGNLQDVIDALVAADRAAQLAEV